MRHEKIYKRESGERVRLAVELIFDFTDKPIWRFCVYLCAKRKRTWVNVIDNYYYVSQKLSHAERDRHNLNLKMGHVTKEEILEVKRELWQKIEPTEKDGIR